MRRIESSRVTLTSVIIAFISIILLFVLLIASRTFASSPVNTSGTHLLTVHDRGTELGVITSAATVRQALEQNDISIAANDLVEPGLDEKLLAESYQINIFRARPVLVIDGAVARKVLSPYQTVKQIAADADVVLQDEDETTIEPIRDIATHGPGIQMKIDRATPFTLMLYGAKTQAYTQETTVGEMLEDKGIELDRNDVLTVGESTPITAGMTVAIWRNGEQTVTSERAIEFETKRVFDEDQPIGYRVLRSKGVKGVETVAYKVVMKGGKEISREKIRSVITKQPVAQVQVIGVKSGPNALTKSKGAQIFTDSKGVAHRETYYDLPMNVVMSACGGGSYTVRSDGAKIDKDGYVLIAANLSNYPRCSLVETSLGLGKVYDTGGFAAKHPHGFDLATDWSNNNGV